MHQNQSRPNVRSSSDITIKPSSIGIGVEISIRQCKPLLSVVCQHMILTRRDVVDLDADVSQLLSAAVDSPRIPLSPHAQGKFPLSWW